MNQPREFTDLSIIHVLFFWTFVGTAAYVAWRLNLVLAG